MAGESRQRQVVGVVRGVQDERAIALVRVEHVLSATDAQGFTTLPSKRLVHLRRPVARAADRTDRVDGADRAVHTQAGQGMQGVLTALGVLHVPHWWPPHVGSPN